MINQLRKVFKSLMIYQAENQQLKADFKWFLTEEQEIIGIHKDELSTKDVSIIEAFLTPYNINFPILTALEEKWRVLIDSPPHTSEVHYFEIDRPYRFVSFSIKKDQTNPISLKEAIQEIFGKKLPILWNNGHEGIIIEEEVEREDNISYAQIIDVLMSDLYVKISFLVGPFREGLEGVHAYYETVTNAANVARRYSSKAVMTYTEVVPYLLIDQTPKTLRREIGYTILQEYIDDLDTLQMINTFVQCNLNVSEASKVLHMHRNSLQYRLDRFHDQTGLDIRQFNHAMTAYLAYIAKE